MSCGQCKTLHCNCPTCMFRDLNEPHMVSLGKEKYLCPACGETGHFEDMAMAVDDYSYESHKYFEGLKHPTPSA